MQNELIFLTSLVIVMTLMSWLVTRFQASPEDSVAGADEVAAIVAAIAKHRNQSAK